MKLLHDNNIGNHFVKNVSIRLFLLVVNDIDVELKENIGALSVSLSILTAKISLVHIAVRGCLGINGGQEECLDGKSIFELTYLRPMQHLLLNKKCI